MRVPLIGKIGVLVVVATAFYTYVGQLVPQKEVYPPAEVELQENMTPDEMAKVGRQIMEGKGLCMTCHTIGKSAGPLRFPDLGGIGQRAATRVPGMTDVQYLEQSLYEPNVYIVPGFTPGMPEIHKPPIGLTDQEILTVIAALQSLGGTPTVTLDTKLAHAGAGSGSGGPGGATATVAGGTPAGGPPSGTTPAPEVQQASGPAATSTPLAGATPASATAPSGDPLQSLGCARCHNLAAPGKGGLEGPSLYGIGSRMDAGRIAAAFVRAHAREQGSLTLTQVQDLSQRLASSRSGS